MTLDPKDFLPYIAPGKDAVAPDDDPDYDPTPYYADGGGRDYANDPLTLGL